MVGAVDEQVSGLSTYNLRAAVCLDVLLPFVGQLLLLMCGAQYRAHLYMRAYLSVEGNWQPAHCSKLVVAKQKVLVSLSPFGFFSE